MNHFFRKLSFVSRHRGAGAFARQTSGRRAGHRKRMSHGVALFFLLAAPVFAQKGFPFQDETLRYSINWPSGLSLGEATFSARHASTGDWNFDATLSAGVPGFAISDHYQSAATADLCSL